MEYVPSNDSAGSYQDPHFTHEVFFFFNNIYVFSCSMWDLVPWPGIEPRLPTLGMRSLSHWTTREVPELGGLVAQLVKNPPAMQETPVWSLDWEDPLEKRYSNPLQYSCLDNPHGQRSLVSYSPWDHKESDMTERLSTAQHTFSTFFYFL